jgi:hypothetical protein
VIRVLLYIAMAVLAVLIVVGELESAPRHSAFYYEEQLRPMLEPARVGDMADACEATVEAAQLLGLEDQTDTLLSMWVQESNFNSGAHGDLAHHDDSIGVAQTRRFQLRHWRSFWLHRHIDLPSFSKSIRTQCFYGVAEYCEHLHAARGDVYDAVRRYNGSGQLARDYAAKVMQIRDLVFHRPYTVPEHQPYR